MKFGERILKLRTEKGMTQDELAQKLGYKSRSSIAKIENGARDVPRSQIVELARAEYNKNLKKKMEIKENLRTIKDLLE